MYLVKSMGGLEVLMKILNSAPCYKSNPSLQPIIVLTAEHITAPPTVCSASASLVAQQRSTLQIL
jgi:hypothetical protein